MSFHRLYHMLWYTKHLALLIQITINYLVRMTCPMTSFKLLRMFSYGESRFCLLMCLVTFLIICIWFLNICNLLISKNVVKLHDSIQIFFPQMYFYTTTKINLNVLNIQYTCQQCLAIIYDISYIILMTRYACLNGFMGTLKFGYLEW